MTQAKTQSRPSLETMLAMLGLLEQGDVKTLLADFERAGQALVQSYTPGELSDNLLLRTEEIEKLRHNYNQLLHTIRRVYAFVFVDSLGPVGKKGVPAWRADGKGALVAQAVRRGALVAVYVMRDPIGQEWCVGVGSETTGGWGKGLPKDRSFPTVQAAIHAAQTELRGIDYWVEKERP